jgi:hypothetical protein
MKQPSEYVLLASLDSSLTKRDIAICSKKGILKFIRKCVFPNGHSSRYYGQFWPSWFLTDTDDAI